MKESLRKIRKEKGMKRGKCLRQQYKNGSNSKANMREI